MNILYLDWQTFGKDYILTSLKNMGHNVTCYETMPASLRHDKAFSMEFESFTKGKYDLVFSSNYYPIISDCLNTNGIPYIAWVYDSPQVLLFSNTINNPVNYIFIFDSALVNRLESLGANRVFYMPLAAYDYVSMMTITEADKRLYTHDISFVGSMYNEDHNLYDRLTNISPYTRGYLNGLLHAQEQVYGYFFLEEMLNSDIIKDMKASVNFSPNADGFETEEYIYANYFLGRKLANIERNDFIYAFSKEHDICVYTTGDINNAKHATIKGPIEYGMDMAKVFNLSKINLNISLRTINSGVPLRCFDILGSGGFLLSNYQSDFMEMFEDGVDYVYFESLKDAIQKADYYLTHEDERKAIALNGYKKAITYYNYKARLEAMINILLEGTDNI